MEDKILKVIFVSVIIFVLGLVLVPYVIVESWSISMGKPTVLEITINNIKNEVDNTIHGNKYKEKIDKYMKEKFGEAVVEKLGVVKYPANYYCKFEEIMDNGFYVSYDKKYDVCSDNFSDIISTDPKFQHLYSEWVKKQIGVDDENVEFGFTGSYETPYVEFDKITTLSEDYSEVFENTHKFYLDTIKEKNSRINEKNYIDYFYDIKDNIYEKSSYITGKPEKPYSLFVYIDNYRFIYNFPEEKIASIKKGNEKIEQTSILNYKN